MLESQHANPRSPPLAMMLVCQVTPPSVLHPWNRPDTLSSFEVMATRSGLVGSMATEVSDWLPPALLTFTFWPAGRVSRVPIVAPRLGEVALPAACNPAT